MDRSEFRIASTRGDAELRCVEWKAEHERAVLQISHGMIEHIERYEPFALFLNDHGITVYGHDHLGHGMTSPDDRGYFAENDGDEHLVDDLGRVTVAVAERSIGLPIFILGHSMGSFILRRYLTRYGGLVDGAVVMGTGNQSKASVLFARTVAGLLSGIRGPRYVSPFLNRAVLQSNDRRFDDSDLPNRWLSADRTNVERYNADPMTSFDFTVSAYRDLFALIYKDISMADSDGIPRDLPMLFVSGMQDPIGGFCKGVEKAARLYERLGMHPEVRFYDGRHEILNDVCSKEVMEDILSWLDLEIGDDTRTLRSSGTELRISDSRVRPTNRPIRSNSPRSPDPNGRARRTIGPSVWVRHRRDGPMPWIRRDRIRPPPSSRGNGVSARRRIRGPRIRRLWPRNPGARSCGTRAQGRAAANRGGRARSLRIPDLTRGRWRILSGLRSIRRSRRTDSDPPKPS